MGIISNLKLEFDTYPPNRIMKLCLLAIALVAGVIAEPESKPWLYGYGGYGLGYGGYYGGYGLGGYHYLGKRSADAEPESKAESDPYVVGYYPYGNGYALGGYGYGLYGAHLVGKRSADAEPESKPWIYGGYGYGGYGLGYGGLYRGYGYGHYLGKRSADASQKASHGTDTVDMAAILVVMVLVIVDIMVGENKPSKSYYNNDSKLKETFFKLM